MTETERAIAIIEGRLPLYTDIGQINALRECIYSIRAADEIERLRALAQQPLSVQEGWMQALGKPFCVLFLDGRNEHGSHVLSSFPRSFDPAETNIEDEAETILAEAEALGFSIGDQVWAEFDWIAPQIDNEGRTELTGYWEFKRINPEMSRVFAPTVGGEE